MTTSLRSELHNHPQRVSRIARWARMVYLVCTGLFAACILLQVFFAGAGVLVHPNYWSMHIAFGHMIELLAFAMLMVGFFGRLPWRMHGLNVLVIVLFMLQYIFLYVPDMGVRVLRALHAVNALVLFWVAVYLAQCAWRLSRRKVRRNVAAMVEQGANL